MKLASCHPWKRARALGFSLVSVAPRPPRIAPALMAPVLMGFVLLMLGGCDLDEGASSAKAHEKHAASPARELLERAMKRYNEAASYADAGELRESVVAHGETQKSEPFPFSITFARPNKLRFHSLGATIVCDGEHLWAAVLAPECAGQVLTLPAPPTLRVGHLTADPMLEMAAQGQFHIQPPQLAWLLEESPPQLPDGAVVEQLPDAELSDGSPGSPGVMCHRVQVTLDEDPSVYWLDSESLMLRRYEFPSKRIAERIAPEAASGSAARDFKVWADFKAAQFHPKLPSEAFAFESPSSAQLVKKFIGPPPPPPSPLVGHTVGPFSFADMQGNPVTSESLAGKVVALEMWVTFHGGYQRSLPQLQKVHQKFANNPRVAVLAVNDDAADVADAKVSRAVDALGVHVPVVRDRSEAYRSVFQLEGWPTLILMGPDGVVESVSRLDQEEGPEVLARKIDSLLAGQSLHATELANYEQAKRRYESELSAVSVGATREIEIPQADVAPASDPAAIKRTRRWATTEVKSPGNLLVLPGDDGASRLLVIEAARHVAEVDPRSGAVVVRHPLDLPAEAAISYLRSAVDGAGQRYFAAFASAQQQVFVFDSEWKLLVAYPAEGKHPGLSDAILADLDGDGQLELHVAYWGSVGVQTASLDGKRLRSNRSLENVLRMIVLGPDSAGQSKLLCSSGGKSLALFDAELKLVGEIPTPNRSVHGILAAPEGEEARIAALSSLEVGMTTALGLDLKGHEIWTYDMPRGVPRYPVEAISRFPMRGAIADGSGDAWLLPGANGSLHFLTLAGQPIDHYNLGRLPTGLAGLESEGATTLVVATPEDLSAWVLEKP